MLVSKPTVSSRTLHSLSLITTISGRSLSPVYGGREKFSIFDVAIHLYVWNFGQNPRDVDQDRVVSPIPSPSV